MFAWILLAVLIVIGLVAAAVAQLRGLAPVEVLRRLAVGQGMWISAAALPVSLFFVLAIRDYPLSIVLSVTVGLAVLLRVMFALWPRALQAPLPAVMERWFPAGIALAGLVVLAAVSTFLYDNEPFVSDSCIELGHAQIYNRLHMAAPAPPPELLPFLNNVYGLVREGVWRSQYFPGHILAIAAGNAFGASWLINPLFGAGALFLLVSIGASLYDRRTGQLAAILLLFSPFFLILQSEMMSHGSTLFFSLAAVRLLCCPWKSRGRPRRLEFLGGLCLGMALASRPLSALPVAAVVILAPPFLWSTEGRRGARRWGWAALGGLLPISFLLFDNYVATGNPFTAGYHLTHPELHQLGFHGEFTWRVGLGNSLEKLSKWNIWLFGWPFSSYTTVLALFLMKKARRPDTLFLLMTVLLLVAYTFYVFHDNFFGPRFLYEAQGWMALLAARGCAEIYRWLRQVLEGLELRRRLAGVCFLALVPFLASGPLQAYEIVQTMNYRGMVLARRDLMIKPLEPFLNDPSAVVFVNYKYPDYLFIYNIRYYPDGPLFPIDLGEKNEVMYRAFPQRKFYRLTHGVVTPIHVVDGLEAPGPPESAPSP